MRALFHDRRAKDADPNHSIAAIARGAGTVVASARDYWFRLSGATSPFSIRACPTRADAIAANLNNQLYYSSGTITAGASEQVVHLDTNTAAGLPIGAFDLDVTGTFPAVPGTGTWVWGWTSSPELAVGDTIVAILKEYAIPSYGSLADFYLNAAKTNIYHGDPGQAASLPLIAVVPGAIRPEDLGDSERATNSYPIEVRVLSVSLSGQEQAWRKCREYQGTVVSILGDERCRLYREATNFYHEGSDLPTPYLGRIDQWLGVCRFRAEFQNVYREG